MHQLPLFQSSAQTRVSTDSAAILKSSATSSSASPQAEQSKTHGFGWLLSTAHAQLEPGSTDAAHSPYHTEDKRQSMQPFAAQGGQTLPQGAVLGAGYFDGSNTSLHSGVNPVSESMLVSNPFGLKTGDQWTAFQGGLSSSALDTQQLSDQLASLLAEFDEALAQGDMAALNRVETPEVLSNVFNQLTQTGTLSSDDPLMADLRILASMVVERGAPEASTTDVGSSVDASLLGSDSTLVDGSALADLLARLRDGLDQGALSPQLANLVHGALPGQANSFGLRSSNSAAATLNSGVVTAQVPPGASLAGNMTGGLGLNPEGGSGQGANQDGKGGQYSNLGAQYRADSGANAMGTELISDSDKSFKQSFETLNASLSAEVGSESGDELAKVDQAAKVNELSARASQNLKPYTTTIHSQLNEQAWPDEMAEKVMFLASKHIQSAQINMNPVELGPIEVKISVQNEQTVVNFNVQNSNVREMLEANVHRLREMMDGNGVALADVNVGSESSNEGFSGFDEQGTFAQQSGDTDGDDGVLEDTTLVADLGSVALIDERV